MSVNPHSLMRIFLAELSISTERIMSLVSYGARVRCGYVEIDGPKELYNSDMNHRDSAISGF